MKRTLVSILLILALLVPLFLQPTDAADTELRGVWVSSVYNLDYPSKKDLSKEELKQEADAIIAYAEKCNLNAIFLQVRPCADSLYPSSVFPWSEYVSGTQGVAPDGGFDALKYFIQQAHKKEIQVHAWCNPYRVTKGSYETQEAALQSLAEWHPARKNPGYVRFYNGNLYFDPGIPEVRKLILDGTMEIVENYDVDGIHLDDYFYPGADFNDAETYQKYGAAYADIGDFRRASVNEMVSTLHKEIQSAKSTVSFGISPFGIWATSDKNSAGCDTKGGSSYYDHYADSRKWVKEGMVDYIAPQLYWPTGGTEGEFSALLSWWCDTVKGTKVKLYIGMGAYRMLEAKDSSSAWYGTTEIESQLRQISESSGASGVIYFRHGSLVANPAFTRLLEQGDLGKASDAPVQKLAVTRPDGTIKTPLSQFYFTGSSDRRSTLLVNGKTVARSSNGYFGVLLDLEPGKNTFTFQNGKKEVTRVVYRTTSGLMSPRVEEAYPSGTEYVLEGQALALQCAAPRTSKVSAIVGSQLISLKSQMDGTFAGRAVLGTAQDGGGKTGEGPDPSAARPLYVVEKHGFVSVQIAKGTVTTLPKDSKMTATVEQDLCDQLDQPDTSEGANGFLRKGMQANVTKVQNGYALLEGLGYAKLSDLSLQTGEALEPTKIMQYQVSQDEKNLTVQFMADSPTAAVASYQDNSFVVKVSPVEDAFVFEHELFSDVQVKVADNCATYTLTPAESIQAAGYTVERNEQGFALCIKKKPVKTGEKALSGITVMLDAGHGGEARGAVGVDAQTFEKQTNLETALALQKALENAGATVLMTRTDDTDLSLSDRVSACFERQPDVFLSLHSNSAEDNVDMSKLSGVGLYLKSGLAQPLADALAAEIGKLGRTTTCKNDSHLYVCRSEFTLSLLLENEYITSPNGFEVITSQSEREALCGSIVAALSQYFAAPNDA